MNMNMNTVADIPDSHTLVSDGEEQSFILERIGEDPDDWSHGRVFVDTNNGEYSSVVWFPGIVPDLQKPVTEIHTGVQMDVMKEKDRPNHD